jgi:hypothetical protein
MSEDRAPTIRVAIIAGMPWLDDRYVRQKNDERRFSPGTRRREGRWISAWAPHAAALLPRKLPPRGPGPRFIASWRIQCREDVEMFYKSIIAATACFALAGSPYTRNLAYAGGSSAKQQQPKPTPTPDLSKRSPPNPNPTPDTRAAPMVPTDGAGATPVQRDGGQPR